MSESIKVTAGPLKASHKIWLHDLDLGQNPSHRFSKRELGLGVPVSLRMRGLIDANGSLTDEGLVAAIQLRQCRECGCTENDCSGCIARTGRPCYWVKPDLCSACVAVPPGGGTFRTKRIPNSLAKEIHLERLADDSHIRGLDRKAKKAAGGKK